MIVAEIGQNWDDIGLAQYLIRLAKINGASWVKFQLFDAQKSYGKRINQELTQLDVFNLYDYAEKVVGIPCYFSVFDEERVGWCEEAGVKFYKIAFSQRNNIKLIDCIKSTGKKIIVSSDEILPHLDPDECHYLYCIPKYPATERDIWHIKEHLEDKRFHGFSDHFVGTNIAKIAISLGAWEIEKHFAIDHQTGVDAPWSMTPAELANLADFEQLHKYIAGDPSMQVEIPIRNMKCEQ